MKVLVAGSTGLAGSAVFRAFVDVGHEVIGINRSNLNLFDFDATNRFISSVRPDLIVDAAARVGGIGANNKYPVDFLTENLTIQGNLMKAAYLAEVRKFVFLGSSCIYPRNSGQPIKEEYLMTGALEPSNSAYAVAKIAGIELINSYRKQYGFEWISLMPTNLYGPFDNFKTDESHVLPSFIRRFVEAVDQNLDSVTMWGSGEPMREFLHADDLASAVVKASESYNSGLHLNIGTGEEISIKNLADLVALTAGYSGRIEWDMSKPDGTPRKVLDVSGVKALGWTPRIGLKEGIASMVTWYREARSLGVARI